MSLPVCLEPRAKRTRLFTFLDVGNAVTIFVSTQSACAQMRFSCTDNRVIFMCTNELKDVCKLPFLSRKEGCMN